MFFHLWRNNFGSQCGKIYITNKPAHTDDVTLAKNEQKANMILREFRIDCIFVSFVIGIVL